MLCQQAIEAKQDNQKILFVIMNTMPVQFAGLLAMVTCQSIIMKLIASDV